MALIELDRRPDYQHAALGNPSSLRPLPGDFALLERNAVRRRASHDLLGAEWQSRGRAGRLPAWRTGRWFRAGTSPLLRFAILSNHRVRPARLRPLDAAGRSAG